MSGFLRQAGMVPAAALLVCLASAWATGAGTGVALDPALIGQPPVDAWPTYHGDYTGQHYSPLDQINQSNVRDLKLAWSYRANTNRNGAVVGGSVDEAAPFRLGGSALNGGLIRATPIAANGMLYFSAPDHAWAVDARTGKQAWHFYWKTRGGEYTGNRGVAVWNNYVYFGTPDGHLVSLDARTGAMRWFKQVGNYLENYYASTAPVVIGNHLMVGLSGDALDVPAWIEARDLETGEIQWKWYTTPTPGSPEAKTWPNDEAMRRGGGMTWQPVTYDPQLRLVYVATGNPNPMYDPELRKGDNLYSCSIVALDVDTGKLRWYYQTAQNEAWDFDTNQVPVLVDTEIDGKARKLVAQATRNGLYFLLDRETGQHILTSTPYEAVNWFTGIDAKGHAIRDETKVFSRGGSLISPGNGGIQNWVPPAYLPSTGMLYVNATQSFELHYTFGAPDARGALGKQMQGVGGYDASLRAIDVRTGQTKWIHRYAGSEWSPGRPENYGGLLATAGNLVFAGAPGGFMVAYDPSTGRQLWHASLPDRPSNTVVTYMLDGKQYLVFAANDTVYAYAVR